MQDTELYMYIILIFFSHENEGNLAIYKILDGR